MNKVYVVDLTPEEQEELLRLLNGDQARVRKTNRVRILLLADQGRTDEEVAEALLTSVRAVASIQQKGVSAPHPLAL